MSDLAGARWFADELGIGSATDDAPGLLEAAPTVGLIRCDRFLTVVDVEITACRLLGRRRSELLDQPFLRFVHDDEVEAFVTLSERLAGRGLETATVDLQLEGRSGAPWRVQLTITFLPTEGGEGTGMAAGKGEFLLALVARPRRGVDHDAFEVATDSFTARAPDLIMRYRLWPERSFEYVSPSSTTVMGYPPSAFYANADLLHELVPEAAELEQLFTLYEGRWEPREPVMLHIVHRDGRVRVLEQRATCVLDGERRVLAIESISRDVTDRAESQLRLSTGAAIRRLFHEKTPVDLEAAEPAEILTAALDAMCTHLEWPIGHAFLMDSDPGYLSSVGWHLRDPERFDALLAQTDEHHWPVEYDLAGDAVILAVPTVTELPDDRSSARSRLAAACGLTTAVALPVPVDGGVGAVIELFTEGSAPPDPVVVEGLHEFMVEVGQALVRNDKILHLRRLDHARQEFVSRAAHELRGPVGSIALMASALAREARQRDQDAMASSLEGLALQAERIQTMATRLLALSQLEEGRLEVRLEPIEVLVAARAAVAVLAPSTDPPVDIDVAGALVVQADPVLLDEVLGNLLANARRHGGPTVRIEAGAEADGREVAISVVDDGPGIPADAVGRLFEPMRRGLATPDRGGLGLALVRRMAAAMGGSARYEPNAPHGARFTVVLPAPAS